MIFSTRFFVCSRLWDSRVNWNKQVINLSGPLSRFSLVHIQRFPEKFSLSRNENRNCAHDSLYCVTVFKRDRRKTMGKSVAVNTLFIEINGKTVQTWIHHP